MSPIKIFGSQLIGLSRITWHRGQKQQCACSFLSGEPFDGVEVASIWDGVAEGTDQTVYQFIRLTISSKQEGSAMRKILIAASALSLLGLITTAWAASDDSGTVSGQAKSNEPMTGAGSTQGAGANSEDQGGTGVKGSAQGEGATNKDTQPRDTAPVVPE